MLFRSATPPAGGTHDASTPNGGLGARLRNLRWRWSEQQLFSLFLAGFLIYAIWEATSFSFFGRWFPMGLAFIGLTLASVQFLREGVGVKTGDIMDIGIRSRGMEGARAAAGIFLGLLALMLLIAGLIPEGLKWGAVLLALIGPPIMMRDRVGLVGGVIGGAIILTINMLFFDYLLAVFWPDAFLLEWLFPS